MGGDVKVLSQVRGKPLIHYLLDTFRAIGIQRPLVVVGYQQEAVRKALQSYEVQFVDQGEPKGTGHAVQVCESAVASTVERAIITMGDAPFFTPDTFRQLSSALDDSLVVCSMVTTALAPETEKLARIVRSESGDVQAIVEYKNATPEQLELTEVNAGAYCARLPWLWTMLAQVKPNPVTNEYYLTDIVKLAIAQGERVAPIMVSPAEAIGVDTHELLQLVRSKSGDSQALDVRA